jgi:hypothetical protein
MLVRFRTASGSGTVPYDLSCPLGFATNQQLEALADRAIARIRGAPA